MNITKIEWCDTTVNPVVGCPHGCAYCYARKQAKRQRPFDKYGRPHKTKTGEQRGCWDCYNFVPHPHLERLKKIKPTQKPKKIFIDSMWDWNAKGVKREWLLEILKKMRECPQHTFQILSKRPARYSRFSYPPNAWLGTSIATNHDLHRIDELLSVDSATIKFVSVEPIHERIDHDFSGLDWIIVGAETGNRKGKIVPERWWIDDIIKKARGAGIPVFIKDNVNWNKTVRKFPVM